MRAFFSYFDFDFKRAVNPTTNESIWGGLRKELIKTLLLWFVLSQGIFSKFTDKNLMETFRKCHNHWSKSTCDTKRKKNLKSNQILIIALIPVFKPQREEIYLLTCAPNEDSSQSVHSHSLLYSIDYPKCAQWRFWSDCANAQSDLILRWVHMS